MRYQVEKRAWDAEEYFVVADTSQQEHDGKNRVVCSEPIDFSVCGGEGSVSQVNDDGEQAMQKIAELMNREFGQEVCQCGRPVTQDSCPECGTWNDTSGRR